MPIVFPCRIKSRQSSAVWFHPASSERRRQASTSESVSRTVSRASETAIADLVFGRLVEARLAARHPVGHPVEHGAERHLRIAEESGGLGAIGEPGGLRFRALELGFYAHTGPKLFSQPAHRKRLRPADIDGRGRRR